MAKVLLSIVSWLKRKARQRGNLTAYTIIFPPKIKYNCTMTPKVLRHVAYCCHRREGHHTQLRASQCLRSTKAVIRNTAAVSCVAWCILLRVLHREGNYITSFKPCCTSTMPPPASLNCTLFLYTRNKMSWVPDFFDLYQHKNPGKNKLSGW